MQTFLSKRPTQLCVLAFDFSDDLTPDESLTGTATVSVALLSGTSLDASGLIVGVPVIDQTQKTRVLVPVSGGDDGTSYVLTVTALTTNLLKNCVLPAVLPVSLYPSDKESG